MRTLPFIGLFALASCAAPSTHQPVAAPLPMEVASTGEPSAVGTGVLVMAHGGGDAWNADVRQAVDALSDRVPVAIAFGMANRSTLSEALEELRAEGAERVAVVRLFLSGDSFFDQTLFYLGLSDAAPDPFLLMGPGASNASARTPIEHGLDVATHRNGLLDSDEAHRILVDRALSLTRDRERESVLLLAHGMGDNDENEAVLDAMRPAAAELLREGVARAEVATLREDWDEARAVAERRIRAFVAEEHAAGRRVVVVPARLSGFGPYADVLAGLEYEAADGLLPHPEVGSWLLETATRVSCAAGWGAVVGPCPRVVVDSM